MQETNRENWRYQPIPESRIDKQAVKYASEKLKLNEEWVRRIHEHQWKLVFDYLENGKTVYIPGMFRTMLRVDYLEVVIGKLDREKTKVDKLILATRKRIEKCKTSHARSVRVTRVKQYQQKLAVLIDRNNELLAQIKEVQEQMMTRSSIALKPSREKYHEVKMKEDNKKRKVRRKKKSKSDNEQL